MAFWDAGSSPTLSANSFPANLKTVMNVVTQQETERWRLAESSAFRGSAQDPTRSLQDSVRLLLDVRFVGLPAVPQDLSKL
jgi:hypothetical protein